MARVSDEEQSKGNLGGPDLFLAPIGRIEAERISKHFCNTCEKEYEDAPKIEYENPNEEVAENLVLAERGQYICTTCGSTIAEYREFKKPEEGVDVGLAKPIAPDFPEPESLSTENTDSFSMPEINVPNTEPTTEFQTESSSTVSSIEGLAVYDQNANKIGTAKQVGIDSTQSMVLVVIKNDGSEGSIPWSGIKKVGEIILLGNPDSSSEQVISQTSGCPSCNFDNKPGSKFCEECGTKL